MRVDHVDVLEGGVDASMHRLRADDLQLLLVQTLELDLEVVVASDVEALKDQAVIKHPGFLVEAAGIDRSDSESDPSLGTCDSSHGDHYLVIDDEHEGVFENSVDQLCPLGVLRYVSHDEVHGERIQRLLMLDHEILGQLDLK